MPEPRHEAPGDLHHAEHSAITDQAAQLVRQWNEDAAKQLPEDPPALAWLASVVAVLREVARG